MTLRFAFPDDTGALARLAALDSSEPPARQVLIAEVDGEPRAALSLSDGMAVADPFHPTAALLELLRARAKQLSSAGDDADRTLPRIHYDPGQPAGWCSPKLDP